MKLNKQLVLGSKSPRRASLLKEMGFDFKILVTDADENAPLHLNGEETALWISEQKALALQPKLKHHELGITSDTEVWLGNKRYGKASNKEAAFQMIKSLSGKTHQVITGLTLSTTEDITSYCSVVQVTLADITAEEIEYYVNQFKPFDKAGAYGIQEWIGHTMVTSIQGEYNAVVGLPTTTLYKALKQFKI
ncbi:MAG: septum formation protein Maf [Flavobacteriales bacterium]|mgnify:FL=1|nr:septum formation protein Maf [Flavobacteriales bacterium]|tara:strand:+ start:447 stop:1022 length:576 start_codon:yes stop_codon:yes gene_type:complete